MKNDSKKYLLISTCMLITFALWTIAISIIDVQPVNPQDSTIGFATINKYFHNLTGVHLSLYNITDWLGLIPLAFMLFFALLGLIQWVNRKSLKQVDYSLFVLGGYYIAVMSVYILFEIFVINYRPILNNGHLEASYPSSTTLLVLCVMPTTIMQLNERMKNNLPKKVSIILITAFTLFMVIARFISGVHWFTDIVGGILLSAGLVMLYTSIVNLK